MKFTISERRPHGVTVTDDRNLSRFRGTVEIVLEQETTHTDVRAYLLDEQANQGVSERYKALSSNYNAHKGQQEAQSREASSRAR